MEKKWIILHVIGNDAEPAWWGGEGENRKPCLYDTQKEAAKACLWNFISSLTSQSEDLDNDSREPDEIDWEHDEWIQEVNVSPDGTIYSLDGDIFYDPKKGRDA